MLKTLAELQSELLKVVPRVFRMAVEQYGSEGIYGAALYTSGEIAYVFDTLLTYQGLETVARRYLENKSFREECGTLDAAMRQLKWSPCDSPHHCEFQDHFKHANELIEQMRPVIDDNEVGERMWEEVHGVFIGVLKGVRNTGIFDDSVVLNVLMGDQSDEERLLNAEILNSSQALMLFEKELEIDPITMAALRRK